MRRAPAFIVLILIWITGWAVTGCSGSREANRKVSSNESLARIEHGWHLSVITDSTTEQGIIVIDSAEIKIDDYSIPDKRTKRSRPSIKLNGIRIEKKRKRQTTVINGDSVTIQTEQSAIKEEKQNECTKTRISGATLPKTIIVIIVISGITAYITNNKRKN